MGRRTLMRIIIGIGGGRGLGFTASLELSSETIRLSIAMEGHQ